MSTWYEEMLDWLKHEHALAEVEDRIVAAGLAHHLTWEQVKRMLACLPAEADERCPYCRGLLELWHEETRCWRCAACGRLHDKGVDVWRLDYDTLPHTEAPEPFEVAVDIWRLAARERLNAELTVLKGGAA